MKRDHLKLFQETGRGIPLNSLHKACTTKVEEKGGEGGEGRQEGRKLNSAM